MPPARRGYGSPCGTRQATARSCSRCGTRPGRRRRRAPDKGFGIRDSGFGIRDSGFGFGVGIRRDGVIRESRIPNPESRALDVRRFIDEQRFGRYQFLIAGLCAAIVFIDGFDAQVMGFVAPALSAELHIPRVTLGTVISSGTFGMMVGALAFGPLADRFGRKPVLVVCALTFGAGSLLTSTATSVAQLTAFRVFTGLGMGGAMPNAIALTSEYMPRRSRNAAVMTMFCGFSLGSACAGWVVAAVIRRFGWQSVFLVGGSIPILLAIVLIAALPESIRFLVLKGGQQKRVVEYLARIAPGVPVPDEVIAGEDEHARGAFSVRQLFAGGRAIVTLLLWTMFFTNLLNLWFLNNWL